MTFSPKRPVTQQEVTGILCEFHGHLVCWKVGLETGSLVYFDMGRKRVVPLKAGNATDVGSVTLILEGYSWAIYHHEDVLTRSEHVTSQVVNDLLLPRFAGQSLCRIREFDERNGAAIEFTDYLRIDIREYVGDNTYVDDLLFLLYLPDNRCLVYHTDRGYSIENTIVSRY